MSESQAGSTGGVREAQVHVFFDPADCAGFVRRVVAIAVDLLVLVALLFAHAVILGLLGVVSPEGEMPSWCWASFAGIAYLYLTLLKRSRLRSPGYWVTGLRIVDLQGRPPSMLLMSMRLLWWVLGPINPLVDLLFMTNDDRRQTIRDKLMGTYVVRKDASPAGRGRRCMESTSFMGLMLLCPVVRPAPARPGDGAGADAARR